MENEPLENKVPLFGSLSFHGFSLELWQVSVEVVDGKPEEVQQGPTGAFVVFEQEQAE